jgi:hypothetical protein
MSLSTTRPCDGQKSPPPQRMDGESATQIVSRKSGPEPQQSCETDFKANRAKSGGKSLPFRLTRPERKHQGAAWSGRRRTCGSTPRVMNAWGRWGQCETLHQSRTSVDRSFSQNPRSRMGRGFRHMPHCTCQSKIDGTRIGLRAIAAVRRGLTHTGPAEAGRVIPRTDSAPAPGVRREAVWLRSSNRATSVAPIPDTQGLMESAVQLRLLAASFSLASSEGTQLGSILA